MANPYPMQGQMMQPPMGGPPMGGPPMGPQNAPRPMVRHGTSKAVPIVISMGLAVGVFCGLLFGVGTGAEEAEAAPTETVTSSAPKKQDAEVPDPFAPQKKDVKVPSLAPQVVKDGSASAAPSGNGSAAPASGSGGAQVAAGSGSGAAPSAGTGSAATKPAAPTKVVGTLKIEVLPEAAAKVAKVMIEGKEIEGRSYELDMTDLAKAAKDPKADLKKELKVWVKASGYVDRQTKVEVVAEKDTTLKVDLVKRSSGGNLPRPTVPSGGNTGGGNKPPPKCKKPPCGLIDI